MFSTSGEIQYIGGVHYIGGVFSTLGEYHEYIGGVSTLEGTMSASGRGDIMNTLGMFSTLGDIIMHVGDTMSTLRDVQYIRGYHGLSSCSPTGIMISL